MNTIKFSSIIEGRTETSDVTNFDIIKRKFENKVYDVYSDHQLSIYVTDECNGNCSFCLNKKSERFKEIKKISDQEYLEMLEEVLIDFNNENKPWVTLTGGEITKSSRIMPVINLLNKYGYKIRTFNTNGSGLLDMYDNKELIGVLLNNCHIHNFNIKRNAINDEQNAKLMRIPVVDSNNQKLKKIAMFNKLNVEIRLSCNLLRSGVNDLNKVIEFKNFYNDLGFKSVMFRETDILVSDILKEIKNNKDFELLDELNGHYYTVYVYKYKDKEIVKVYLEKKIKEENIIRELVLYPDGILTDGYSSRKVGKYGKF